MRFLALVVATVCSVATVAAVLAAALSRAGWASSSDLNEGSSSAPLALLAWRASWICALVITLQYVVARLEKLAHTGTKLNLQRIIQHVASGVTILLLFKALPLELSELALSVAVVAFGAVQAMRMWSSEVNRQFLAVFGSLLRDAERNGSPPAAFYFLLGCLLSTACFPHALATFAILCATLADPLAALGGSIIGGPRLLGQKTLGGFLACSTAGAVLGFACLGPAARSIGACMACGLAAGLSELLGGHKPHLDDNLTCSFGAGLILRCCLGLGLPGLPAAAVAFPA